MIQTLKGYLHKSLVTGRFLAKHLLKVAAPRIRGVIHYLRSMRKKISAIPMKTLAAFAVAGIFFLGGFILLLATTITTPDLGSFDARKVEQSTKIYDRTGKILLYDLHQDMQRTEVPFADISPFLKEATISVEDGDFYNHGGIKISSTIRAVLKDILIKLHLASGYTQGGSTITQQVVKNSILVKDKTVSRKIKEWILAMKLEQKYSKDEILGFYLNESPYGGSIYGVEEAAQTFFGTSSKNVTLAQAAYIAALPQAPTFYSPYGNHRDRLDERKNLVLSQMKRLGHITDEEYEAAKKEQVTFLPQRAKGILAPHFVFFIREYLAEKYGEEALENQGLRVTTTIDFDLQQKGEEIVKQYALENEKKFNASNASLVAIDPKTGQILTMVGSRDYFDEKIDGNFNAAIQPNRQPGSSFKPFIYATAFAKGYTPETVLFDVPTQFSTACEASNFTSNGDCYSPGNYDDQFRGPMTLREALAQSINIPAVKLFYLAGTRDSLRTAQSMGIQSLGNINRYGLTLVLGGGEVSLIDMTSAYGVFANEGVRNPYTGILKVEDGDGEVLEEFKEHPTTVLDRNAALTVSDVLSDNVARTPGYGPNSPLHFPGYDVAAKTGTTNETRDTWILGYTPQISVGAWAGNNDNSPMVKKVAGLIIAPMWNAFMQEALKKYGSERFEAPLPNENYQNLKPVLRGYWQGGTSIVIDKSTGKLATSLTPPEMRAEQIVPNVHSILYWVNKNDPLGPPPTNPESDPQFRLWEYGVSQWVATHGVPGATTVPSPQGFDDVHTTENAPKVTIQSPKSGTTFKRTDSILMNVTGTGKYPLSKVDFFANGAFIGSATKEPFVFSFTPDDFSLSGTASLSATAYDSMLNKGSSSVSISVTE